MRLLTLFMIAFLAVTANIKIAQANDNRAKAMAINAAAECEMQESASFSISFNGQTNDINEISAFLEKQTQGIIATAKQNGIDKVSIKNKDISINSNDSNNNTNYNYSSRIAFNVVPANKSYALLEILKKKNYNVSLNINSYNNNECDH